MKEQNWKKIKIKQNKLETSNLPDEKFKILIISMLNELGEKNRWSHRNKEWKNIKKNPPELKNTIAEMKKMLEGINSKLDETENQIINLEKVAENTWSKKQKEKKRILKTKIF